jgi:hypothetical protein
MNRQDVLLAALSKRDPASASSEKQSAREGEVFAGFESDDEVIAAFLDGKLTPQQSDSVKRMLVASPSLRQLWQASASALSVTVSVPVSASASARVSASMPASNQTFTKSRKSVGVQLSMVASVAMVAALLAVLAVRSPELWQPTQLASSEQAEQLSPEGFTPEILTPETNIAPQLASQAVPLMAWKTYLAAYQLRDEGSVRKRQENNDYAAFAILAQSLVALEGACSDDKTLILAQQHFTAVAQEYPAAMMPMTPVDRQQWCGLGVALQQYANLAVLSSIHKD